MCTRDVRERESSHFATDSCCSKHHHRESGGGNADHSLTLNEMRRNIQTGNTNVSMGNK